VALATRRTRASSACCALLSSGGGWAAGRAGAAVLVALLCAARALAAEDAAGPAPGLEYGVLLEMARQAAGGTDSEAISEAFAAARAVAPDEPSRARCWYEEGLALEGRGLREAAAAAYEALAASPDAGPVLAAGLQRLARLYQRGGALDKAAATYERLLAAVADQPPALEQVLVAQARLLRQMGAADKAAAAARRLLDLNPRSPLASEAANILVDLLLQSADWAGARKLAEQEAARQGGDSGLLLRVGLRLQQAGRQADALEMVEAYAVLHPEEEAALQTLYDLHRQQGTLDAYARKLKAAAAEEATRAGALRRLADLEMRRDAPAQALPYLEALLRLEPEDAALAAAAGRAALAAGLLDAARDHLGRALELDPDNTAVQSDLGDAYARRGDMARALELWKLAAGYAPGNLDSARLLGRRLQARGHANQALAIYEEALAAWREEAARPGPEGTPPMRAEGNPLALECGEAQEALLALDKAVACYLEAMAPGGPGGGHAGQAEYRLRQLMVDDVARPFVVTALAAAAAAGPVPDSARVVLALARLRDGDAAGATTALLGIPVPARRGAEVLRVGADLEGSGQAADAAALYRAALEATAGGQGALPASVAAPVSLRLAGLQRAAGRWPEAVRVLEAVPLERLILTPLGDEVRLALADILVTDASEPGRARTLYEEVASRTPDGWLRTRAQWGLADCTFASGDYTAAAALYQALAAGGRGPAGPGDERVVTGPLGGDALPAAHPPGADYAALRLAEILFRAGDTKRARAAFSEVATRFAGSPSANDALARVLLIDTAFADGSPARGPYLEALGRLDRGDLEGALRGLDMIAATGPGEALGDEAAFTAAQGVARLGDAAAALARYQALPGAFPESPLGARALLEAARLSSDQGAEGVEPARELCRKLLAGYPTSPEAAQAEDLLAELTRQ
jgi:tetratricopeptide (TPR) repeat protein